MKNCRFRVIKCLLLNFPDEMTQIHRIIEFWSQSWDLGSRDITLSTKVHLVKAIVFPMVMYGWELDCEESWVPKNWCFWTVVLEKTLEHPLNCKEIQPVHPKGDQSWVFIGRTDAEAETPVLWPPHAKSWLIWKDPDAGKDWGQEEKGTTEDEMVGWHHRLDGHGFGWTLGVGGGQGGLAGCGSRGRRVGHNWATELNWTVQLQRKQKQARLSTLLDFTFSERQRMCAGMPVCAQLLSCIQLFVTPWTVAGQASLFVGLSGQEYWSGLLFPFSRGSSWPRDQTTSLASPVLAGGLFTTPRGRHKQYKADYELLFHSDRLGFTCKIPLKTGSQLKHSNTHYCQEPAHEIPPMTRSWGEDLTSKADQDLRDFKKLPRRSP